MRLFLLLLFLLGMAQFCGAQQSGDTLQPADTLRVVQDSMPAVAGLRDSIAARRTDTGAIVELQSPVAEVKPDTEARLPHEPYAGLLRQHPYYNFFGKPRVEMAPAHRDSGKDGLFYLFVGIVLYYALVRLVFGKYLENLYTVFFRVSLKQKQIREQLMQSPLPSLLLNIFFIITGGVFITLMFRHYHYLAAVNSWYLMLYCTLAIAVVYLGKFLILKLMGWVFFISEATDTYIFAVFLVNKIIGIFLVPFVVLLAFSDPAMVPVVVILSFTLLAILFLYRYIISYAPVRKEIKVSQFHFILYLCGFEIIPLLLTYKVLITFLEGST